MTIPAPFSVLDGLPLALLLGAIALFKLSTLQMRWPLRPLAWAGGALGLTVAAGVSLSDPEDYGVWRALGDRAAHWRAPGESVVGQALAHNLNTLPDYVGPLIDFAIFVAGLIGLLCLAAFTPGERLERAARSLFIGVIGIVIGGVLTVGVVALGFGGEAHRAVIFATVGHDNQVDADLVEASADEVRVHDGDTLYIGQTAIRLWGIEAPELDQTCDSEQPFCGVRARDYLFEYMKGRILRCEQRFSGTGRRLDTFGRLLMSCSIQNDRGNWEDIGSYMVRQGYADIYYPRRGGVPVDSEYKHDLAPFTLGCTLRPDWWRHARTRTAWEGDRGEITDAPTIGACPPQSAGTLNTTPS